VKKNKRGDCGAARSFGLSLNGRGGIRRGGEGNILEDESAITALNQSKEVSIEM
jgi:hypothetical protein